MSAPARSLLVLALVGGCELGAPTPSGDRADDDAPRVALSGAALADELATSPVRLAPVSFARIGVRLTGQSAHSVEIATSPDGATWSRWRPIAVHHSELEETASFVGDVFAAGDHDRYYMLRSADGPLPETLVLDFFTEPFSDDVEIGDEATPAALADTTPIQIGAAQVLPRAAWGARPARCSTGHTPRRITIHHTEQPNDSKLSPQALVRSVQSYHQSTRGWCDIGYHFLISADGRIWQGRPVEKLGAHAGAGNNTGNVGIALIGTFTDRQPSEAQKTAAGALIRGLALEYGIPVDRQHVFGHRDMRATECPGDAAYGILDELIARAGGNGPPEEPLPPPTPPGDLRLIGAVYRDGDLADRITEAQVTVDGLPVEVDAFGVWETRVPSGHTVTIEASAPGFETATMSRTATDDPTWASVGLVPEGAVEGTAGFQGVVYSGGDPANRIPHASIVVDVGTVEGGRTAAATENGYWRLTGLAPGYYEVTASAPGYEPATVTRYAAPGSLSWASVELTEGDFSGEPAPGPSCESRCGSPDAVPGSLPQCYCDDNCVRYNDCCKTYFSFCR